MGEPVVCSGCKQPAVWTPRVWGWVCPAGDIVSDQTGRIVGSLAASRQWVRPAVYAWRVAGAPWPEESEAPDG